MAKEEEYTFDDDKKKQSKLASFGHFLWNSETKEFCGRDGASWGKVSLFYAIFYAILGSFFVGMIAVFVQIMPYDKPTYYGESSVMASRGVNPGLGFRPQIDVEDSLVKYTPTVLDDPSFGIKKYVTNLNNFLAAKYPTQDGSNVIDCSEGQTSGTPRTKDSVCRFNHKAIFESTPCSSANADGKFGFDTTSACFLIKLNKIVSWVPVLANSSDIIIKCGGEFSADKDNIKEVIYHSENHLNDKIEGKISPKYFPYNAQKGYQAPFIWAQFIVNPNTLINIDCKAFAKNIDNSDRMNRRGQTKFTLYVKSEKASSG